MCVKNISYVIFEVSTAVTMMIIISQKMIIINISYAYFMEFLSFYTTCYSVFRNTDHSYRPVRNIQTLQDLHNNCCNTGPTRATEYSDNVRTSGA
jgi:hypothetical protein